jgi:ubiquinone biosynthesis protein UbiJ
MIRSLILIAAVMGVTSVCVAQTPAQPTTVAASNVSESWAARADAEMAQCEARLAEVERRLARLEGRL